MGNEGEQNEERWFLIAHGCGSVFTINRKTFIKSYEKTTENDKFLCPNCRQPVIKNGGALKAHFFAADNDKTIEGVGAFRRFLETYDLLKDALKGSTIIEIQDKQWWEAMKNLGCKRPDKVQQ